MARRLQGGGVDPKKPFHTIYGKNRFSGRLITHSRNIRSLPEARKQLKNVREASGHDYTYRIVSHWEAI
jgi:hypothetical protein